jgi:predicted  nucleic acid-binding Zn-ribbon protein
MDNMMKNLLKYTIGISVFLTALALYFFFMMSSELSKPPTPQAQVASTGKDNSSSGPVTAEQCETFIGDGPTMEAAPNDSLLSSLQTDIVNMRSEYDACTATLDQKERDVNFLQSKLTAAEKAKAARNENGSDQADINVGLKGELEQAQQTVAQLLGQIQSLERQNQRLIIAPSSGGDSGNSSELEEEIALLDTQIAKVEQDLAAKQSENNQLSARISALEDEIDNNQRLIQENRDRENLIDGLESEIAQLTQKNVELVAKVVDLEAGVDTPDEPAEVDTSTLSIVKFDFLPIFCDDHVSASQICVRSFELVTNFNFRPNGFISLRLRGPDGDTIQREAIAAQDINLYSFAFDNEILDAGDYTVEIKIDDIFNQFDQERTFTLSLPQEQLDILSNGQ